MARRFEQVFQATPIPMQIHRRPDRRVMALNAAHQQWLGYSLADFADEAQWFERVYADEGERTVLMRHWYEHLETYRSGEPVVSPELTLRCKDGSRRIARGTMTVSGDDVIVAWTDLTEIRRNGYAASIGDRTRGVGGLSIPVFGPSGVEASVTISGPSQRWDMKAMHRAATVVVPLVAGISERLGGGQWLDGSHWPGGGEWLTAEADSVPDLRATGTRGVS